MKDSEFIELLNLYLDHEISAEDAARIEVEVQQNPARRRLYQQYCRLQKACTLLAKDFVEQAATTGSPADRRIVALESRRSWSTGVYVGGLAMAAACVALALVIRSPKVAPAANQPAAVATQSPAKTAADATQGLVATTDATATRAIAQTVTVSAPTTELQPVFTAHGLMLGKGDSATNAGMAVTETPVLRAQFNWMKSIEFSPIQRMTADELRFESKANPNANPQVFGPGRVQPDVQQAAFQFQR
jgi:hypothetical protein